MKPNYGCKIYSTKCQKPKAPTGTICSSAGNQQPKKQKISPNSKTIKISKST